MTRLVAANDSITMFNKAKDLGRMCRCTKVGPGGVLYLRELSDGLKGLICMLESYFAKYNVRCIWIKGWRRCVRICLLTRLMASV